MFHSERGSAQGLREITNMALIEPSFYLLNARSVCVIFFVIERGVLMVLVFYYKGMLENVSMQRTQQFTDFSL